MTAVAVPQFYNHPSAGTVKMDAATFEANTQMIRWPLGDVSGSQNIDFGKRVSKVLDKRGVLQTIKITLEADITIGGTASAISARALFPKNLFHLVQVVGGAQAIHYLDGSDLGAKRQVDFQHAADTISQQNVPAGAIAAGTYHVRQIYDLQLCAEPTHLTGALFNESEANNFQLVIDIGSVAELFNNTGGGTVVMSNQLMHYEVTAWHVPRLPIGPNNTDVTVLPDCTVLYQQLAQDNPVTVANLQPYPVPGLNGQVFRVYGRFQNGGASSAQDIVDPSTLPSLATRSGGNVVDRNYVPAYTLLDENGKYYNGVVTPGYHVHDYVTVNPGRDGWDPGSTASPQILVDIGSSVPNAGAIMHTYIEGVSRNEQFQALPNVKTAA